MSITVKIENPNSELHESLSKKIHLISLHAGEGFGFEEYINKHSKRKFTIECSNQGTV